MSPGAIDGMQNRIEHVLRFARNAAGRAVRATELGDDMISTIFDALSREEESRIGLRDEWGNWDWPHAVARGAGDPNVPWLDTQLERCLGRQTAPRWPDGKRFALCLTHDVDSVSHRQTPFAAVVESVRRLAGDGTPGSRAFAMARLAAKYASQRPRMPGGRDPLWHYEDWLILESKYGFRSTFFAFPGRVANPHAWDANYRATDRVIFDGVRMTAGEMFRRIAERGWEIGVHGSYRSAQDAGILADERSQIERMIDARVGSVRQHYLHYDAATTPAVQAAAGLCADSTQGYNRGTGFRAGTTLPYWCWDWSADAPVDVLEIPQHIMDGALFSASALGHSAESALAHLVQIMDHVESVGGCLTLNWHPEYLNVPTHWEVYKTVLQEAQRRNAWGCSVRDVYEWWSLRDRTIGRAVETHVSGGDA